MKNHNLLFGTIDLKIVQHSEDLSVSSSDFFLRYSLRLENYGNNEVSVLDFKTRVSESRKVLDLPFFPPSIDWSLAKWLGCRINFKPRHPRFKAPLTTND